jgi:transcriptional regulator with XRE-family HTH domain
MNSLDRLRSRFDEWRDDPDYLYEGVVLELTEQIVARMKERGIRRSDLADRLGTSRAYVTKLLDGQDNMTLKTLARVANALEMKVDAKFIPREHAAKAATKPQTKASVRQKARAAVVVGSASPAKTTAMTPLAAHAVRAAGVAGGRARTTVSARPERRHR